MISAWASPFNIADSDRPSTLNQQRVKWMCLLGPLNVSPFHKQIYKYKSSVGTSDFWSFKVLSPNSEVWNIKFHFKMAAKKHEQNSNQSFIIKIIQQIQNGRQKSHKT